MKKTLRIAAWMLGGIVLVLGITVTGTLIWLQTDSGGRTVTRLLAGVLEGQGILLSADSLTVLPTRIHAHNLRLADSQGEWLAIRELDTRIRLRDLLSRTVAVSGLLVDTPELFRVPQLPSSPAQPETAPSPPGYLSLPVGLSIDDIAVKDARVHAGLLFPGKSKDNPALLTASVTGKAGSKPRDSLLALLNLNASVADLPALAALLETGPLPVTAVAASTALEASVGQDIQAKAEGVLTVSAGEEKYKTALRLSATLDGDKAELREAFLEGLGIHFLAGGNVDLSALTGKVGATLKTENGAAWQDLLARASGQHMGGAVTASVDAELLPQKAVDARLSVSGENMLWPVEQLQKALGTDLALKTAVSGGGSSPYVLTVDTLAAGTLSATAKAELSPDNNTIAASAKVALTTLTPLAPDVSGALSATASVNGSLSAPTFALEAASDAITTPAGLFGGVRVQASGAPAGGSLPSRATPELSAAGMALSGTAGLSLGKSPAGPVSLRSAWAFSQKPDGSSSARVHDVDLSLAGTSLAADVTAVLPAGEGAPSLDGSVTANVTDWMSLAALTGIPLSGGRAGLDARFSHDAGNQQATASLRADRLEMPDTFSLNDFSAEVEARNFAAPDITLALRMGKGEAGPVGWRSGAANVNAVQGRGAFAAALRTDNSAPGALAALSAGGADARPGRTERLSVAGSFALPALQGTGIEPAGSTRSGPGSPGNTTTLTLNRLAARAPASAAGLYLAKPATFSFGEAIRIENLALNVAPGNGVVTCDALFRNGEASLKAEAKDLAFRILRDFTDAAIPDGTAGFAASLTQKGSSVQGSVTARATIQPGASPESKSTTRPVVFTLDSVLDKNPDPAYPHLTANSGISRLKGKAVIGLGAGSEPAGDSGSLARTPADTPDAEITFNLPLRFSAQGIPAPDMAAPVAANLHWNGEVAPIAAIAPIGDRSLSGLAQVIAELTGTLKKPEYSAKAYMAGGRFEDKIQGVLLTNIALQAESAWNSDSKLLFHAEDGKGGTVALEGGLLLPGAGPKSPHTPRVTARGHINRLSPLHRDDLSIRLSGRISVDGELAAPKVSADVEIERGEISLISSLGGGVRTLEITEPADARKPPAAGPVLDVRVTVPNRFFIRGRGLDSEWEGELAVTGPVSEPSLKGSLRPIRGAFDLLTKPFSFSQGDISFFGGERINPGLNLTLTYEGPTITAMVHARGTAAKPSIAMESAPPLPQDQIIAAVLFGKNFSELSRFEALQVANSVRELANIGQGGLDPLATMRSTLGVDMLRVGSSGGGSGDNRSISNAPGAGDLPGGGSSANGDSAESATPTLEAGKYINDAIYVGVEQGATADSTGVRVEIELRPNLNLQGKTTANSSEVGIGWKKDY